MEVTVFEAPFKYFEVFELFWIHLYTVSLRLLSRSMHRIMLKKGV